MHRLEPSLISPLYIIFFLPGLFIFKVIYDSHDILYISNIKIEIILRKIHSFDEFLIFKLLVRLIPLLLLIFIIFLLEETK